MLSRRHCGRVSLEHGRFDCRRLHRRRLRLRDNGIVRGRLSLRSRIPAPRRCFLSSNRRELTGEIPVVFLPLGAGRFDGLEDRSHGIHHRVERAGYPIIERDLAVS